MEIHKSRIQKSIHLNRLNIFPIYSRYFESKNLQRVDKDWGDLVFEDGKMRIFEAGEHFKGAINSLILLPTSLGTISSFFLIKSLLKLAVLKSIFFGIPTLCCAAMLPQIYKSHKTTITSISLLENRTHVEIIYGNVLKTKDTVALSSIRKGEEQELKEFMRKGHKITDIMYPVIVNDQPKYMDKMGTIYNQRLFSRICTGKDILADDPDVFTEKNANNLEDSTNDIIDI